MIMTLKNHLFNPKMYRKKCVRIMPGASSGKTPWFSAHICHLKIGSPGNVKVSGGGNTEH